MKDARTSSKEGTGRSVKEGLAEFKQGIKEGLGEVKNGLSDFGHCMERGAMYGSIALVVAIFAYVAILLFHK